LGRDQRKSTNNNEEQKIGGEEKQKGRFMIYSQNYGYHLRRAKKKNLKEAMRFIREFW